MHSFVGAFWTDLKTQLDKRAKEFYIRKSINIEDKIKGLISKIWNDLSSEKLPIISFPNTITSSTFDYSLSSYTLVEEEFSEVKHEMVNLNPAMNTAHFAYTLKVLENVYDLIKSKRYGSKREIYYNSPSLFHKQVAVDNSIEELTLILRTTRDSLNVVASTKGLVYGSLSFKVDNDRLINCSSESFSSQSELVPKVIDNISSIESKAQFILVVEKETVYYRLISEKVQAILGPLILITVHLL